MPSLWPWQVMILSSNQLAASGIRRTCLSSLLHSRYHAYSSGGAIPRTLVLLYCSVAPRKQKIAYCPMPRCLTLTQMLKEKTTHLKTTRNKKQDENVSVCNGTYTIWRRLFAYLSPYIHVEAAIRLVGVAHRDLMPSGRNTNKKGTSTLRYPPQLEWSTAAEYKQRIRLP